MSLYLHFPFKYNNQTILDQASTLRGEIEERSDRLTMKTIALFLGGILPYIKNMNQCPGKKWTHRLLLLCRASTPETQV
jgi:hypothetical protein